MQLPVRCAKLIKDMYALRNAKNETKDIKHYSSDECSNPEYELSIFIMNAPFNSELQWVKKNIKPILQEE